MASRGSKARSTIQEEIFVGRQEELALISRRLEEARAGRGSFIAVSGEPGIGKTRLAQAAAGVAKKKGFSVFWGQCHDGQYIAPYWPWKQILRELLELLPSRGSQQTRAIASALSEIVSEARQVPARGGAMPKPIAARARVKILESVTSLLRLVSERCPLLLVLDNLHCADVPSLQLLQVVAREMSRTNIVIIGSHRESPAEAGGPLRETIGALAGQSFFEGIPLLGWDQASVAECLKECGIADPPPHLVQAVHVRTDGNPLFVMEVARLLQQKGLLEAGSAVSAQAWETYIPQKVRLAIQGLFERLSAACRDALGAASILGREFESSLLQEITGEESPAIEAFLKEALTHRLIEEIPEKPTQYRFTHALIQDVVREQIPGRRRSALHLRIGETLERRVGQDVEARAGELARHFDAAGPEKSGKAFVYYRLAGERALRLYGFEDAFEQLSRALDLGKGKCSPLDTARLLFGLAQSQHGLGNLKEAVEKHAQAFDLFVQNGEIDNAVRIFEHPLILTEKPANLTKLLERLERAISLLGPGSPRGEALGALYGLAVYHDTGDYKRAVSIVERALQSARESGNRQEEMYTLSNWGLIESDELHFERACQMEEEAIRLALQSGDLWVEMVSRAHLCVAVLGLGRILEAEKQSRLLLALADRLQTRLWTAISSIISASVHRQRGELRPAREVTDRALALADPSYLVINRASRVLLDYETGELAHAAELLQKVEAEADRAVLPFHWEGLLTLLIPYAAWVTGEQLPLPVAEAAALRVPVAGGLRRGDAVTVSVGLGLIAAIRHDRESAARHYLALLPFRGLVVCPYQGLAADHILALLASTSGDAPRAREHFESALVFCRANGLVLELAYTCRDYAEFLLHTAAKTEAQKILDLCRREANQIAEHSGLGRLKERLEKVQSSVSQSKPGRREYPDSLSEREVDVLRLLGEGLSNAQIGERLFISLHTVANHVQSILEKTGAANRTEAAIYAIRHHLADEQSPRG